jgi:hypothetical protein
MVSAGFFAFLAFVGALIAFDFLQKEYGKSYPQNTDKGVEWGAAGVAFVLTVVVLAKPEPPRPVPPPPVPPERRPVGFSFECYYCRQDFVEPYIESPPYRTAEELVCPQCAEQMRVYKQWVAKQGNREPRKDS